MWVIIYENKTSQEVIMEYHFTSSYEKRRHFLLNQDDIEILWRSNQPKPGWGGTLRAFWRCLIGYRTSRKINE